MTITVQNMSSSVSSPSGSGKANAAGQTTAGVSFDATLANQMNSSGNNASTTSTEVAAKLESLLTQYSSETDASLEGLMELLQGLLQELDTMDQALMEDPSLLQELQNWLTQANVMLSGAAPQSQENTDGYEMSPLASRPETIRFAVQDTISQLASMLSKSGQADLNTEAAVKQLVQSFHGLLGQGAGTGESKASGSFDHILGQKHPDAAQPTVSTNTSGQSASSQTTGQANAKWSSLTTSTQVEGTASEFVMNEGDSLMEQGTVTAGQLALRSGTQVAVKPAAPPVPVENFSNEMTSFIINKLEIVKQTGFTEARISLNPEHLGQVDIKLTMQNGQLIAQFMTRSTDAKELIDQQMAQLRSALIAQGLQVEKIEVTQSSQPSNANLYQDGRQPGSGQQQSQHRSKEKDRPSDDAVLAANLTEELNDWIAEHQADDERVQAGTFTAKA
ncbi:flagellar hook-length control protein FliK [Paenibacillus sp. MDMC362]|uniref:flagellar hook-length control protein FliK n=1 Tax=Paenibacillus sp. MDMC362 TaxID=2977365 RepID=UPI000DC5C145|nr:flagellar hook-length control protein FliK [Paenibacillus sp. MDMC362]RAR43339.1 flagellar hook-length control protein FliK [Paenibacillus sp. MDMC362]